MIALLGLLSLTPAHAVDFSSHPAPVLEKECHPLDFRSSSQARNSEERIRKNNPERSRPNYAGKFLLLKIPYMMETEWLIADCGSGKFFSQTLSGDAEFRQDSALIRVTRKGETHWAHWTGESFSRIDPARVPAPASGAPEKLIEERYAEAFASHPGEKFSGNCAPLDYRSYFRAQQAESHIRKNHPDLARPNFAGSFLLIRVELLFETLHLIADCRSGKFFPEFVSGEMRFRPDSALALQLKRDAPPDLMLWSAPDWIRKPDPTASEPREVENRLLGESARSFLAGIPNPLQRGQVHFKELFCESGGSGGAPSCVIELDDPKISNPNQTLRPEFAQKLIPLLERYGLRTGGAETGWKFRIPRGFCNRAAGACSLFLR